MWQLKTKEPVPVILLRGLTAEQSQNFIQSYKASVDLRERIATVLQDNLDGAVEEAEDDKLYKQPNWELYQADNRGYRRALREAISLLTKDF